MFFFVFRVLLLMGFANIVPTLLVFHGDSCPTISQAHVMKDGNGSNE